MEMSTVVSYLLRCLLFCLIAETVNLESQVCSTFRKAFPKCSCLTDKASNKTHVDCSGLGLTSVPIPAVAIPEVIFEMRLNNNSITSLRNNAFTGLKIRKLDLRDNNIATVGIASFQGQQDYLFHLYIDGNGTSAPPKAALNGLINLLELTLRNYGATILRESSGIFLPFRKLQNLTLDNWKLTNLEPGALLGLKNLTNLIINRQEIRALPLDLLHDYNLISMKRLAITYTKIQDVSSYAFEKLINLQNLDLSNNHISILEDMCFIGLGNSLKSLNLSGNILSADKLNGLTDLPKLTVIDLSSNVHITSVPDLSKLKLTQPLKLYLANKSLTLNPS